MIIIKIMKFRSVKIVICRRLPVIEPEMEIVAGLPVNRESRHDLTILNRVASLSKESAGLMKVTDIQTDFKRIGDLVFNRI